MKPDRLCREGDIFIPPAAMGGAISGDHVRVTVARRRGGKGRGPAGRVDEVLTRSRSTFAGTVLNRRKNWLIRPMVAPCRVFWSSGIHTPSPCVTVTRWCSSWWPVRTAMCCEAAVTEVLGKSGKPDVETSATMHHLVWRLCFPKR